MLAGLYLSGGSGKESFPVLCQLQGVPGILGLWLPPSSVCLCFHMLFFPLCVSVSKDIPATELGPTLIQYDLVVLDHICKDSIVQLSHVHRFGWTQVGAAIQPSTGRKRKANKP